MMRSTVMTVMLALVGIAGAPLTWAQSEQTPTERSTATYSDAELKSFAAAAVDVHRINSTYLPKLAEASADEQRQIEKQALQETTQADEILTAAQSKPEVAKKVEQFLNETPKKPGTTQL